MSLLAPQDTLRHQLARTLCLKRDMSRVKVPNTARAVKEMVANYKVAGLSNPEGEAIKFYLLQHAMSDIRQKFGVDDPMGDVTEIVETHHENGVELSQRMFVYLLLICTREARHTKGTIGLFNKMTKKYGEAFAEIMTLIRGKGSQHAVDLFLQNPPDMELGTYCAGLQHAFYHGKFSGGFGGQKWGKIADLLSWFVHGQISAEMMLDTAFTLAHNGGPIFNKGMVFDHYDKTTLRLVLDVQASGQIPHLIKSADDYPEISMAVTWDAKSLFEQCLKVIGDDFGGHIDWFKVTQNSIPVGTLHIYLSLKAIQTEKFGIPEWVQGVVTEAAKKQAVELKATAKAKNEMAAKAAVTKKVLEGEHFTVGIGDPLKKEKRNG